MRGIEQSRMDLPRSPQPATQVHAGAGEGGGRGGNLQRSHDPGGRKAERLVLGVIAAIDT